MLSWALTFLIIALNSGDPGVWHGGWRSGRDR